MHAPGAGLERAVERPGRGLIDAGVGTALGYESAEGAVLVNPRPSEQITALAIFALVSGDLEGAQARAMAALRASG